MLTSRTLPTYPLRSEVDTALMSEPRKPRRVLVTGATGFVGKALLPALVEAGCHVRASTRGAVPPAKSTRSSG